MTIKPSHRRRARLLALQALYQWLISKNALSDIEAEFRTDHDFSKLDDAYFCELLHQIPKQLDTIDALFSPFMNKTLEELDPIELCVLRMSTYELQNRLDVPYRVVIDEALILTKTFGTVEGYKFVNAVLDKLSHELRSMEIETR